MTKLSHLLVLISIQGLSAQAFSDNSNNLSDYDLTTFESINYYPKEFTNSFHSYLKKGDLKQAIRKVLTSGHVKNELDKDTLVSSCAGIKKCQVHSPPSSYKQARKHMFGDLYLEKVGSSYQVKDVYCNKTYTNKDGIGPMQIPDHTKINCEHSWPQSKFNRRLNISQQKNDLHHLFPVNSRSNSTRSNHPFAEVIGRVVNSECTDSRIGESTYQNFEVKSFEPPVEIRGNIARALFYFSIRYNLPIQEGEENFLRQWNIDDPVDEEERTINNKIERIQNSRNPFVDDQELANVITNF